MQSLSIQWKITLFAGLCLVITAIILVSYSINSATHMQSLVYERSVTDLEASATAQMQAQANAEAANILRYFDEARYRAEVIATDVLVLKLQAQKHQLDSKLLRSAINDLLQASITHYPRLLGLYVVFKPDALDGNDAKFKDEKQYGSNSRGRFGVYWARDPKEGVIPEIMLEEDINDTSIDDNGKSNNQWFACSIKEQRTCILEPYLDDVGDEQQLMTSLTLPLRDQNKIIGILGVDIALSSLQQLIERADEGLFQGQGQITLLSHQGTVAAWDGQEKRVGKPLNEFTQDVGQNITSWLNSQQPNNDWHAEKLQIYTPITFHENIPAWGLLLQLPRSVILASANALETMMNTQQQKNLWTQLLVSFMITIVALFVIFALARSIAKPIKMVVGRLQDIATGDGDLTQRIMIKQGDELGELAYWFNSFLDKLQNIIGQVIESVEVTRTTAKRSVQVAQTVDHQMDTQFQEIDLVATASEQMSYSSKEVVENAQRAVDAADSADTAAQKGKAIAESSKHSMTQLVEYISGAVPVVERLEQDSNNIGSILEVIRSIAEQTNLLALNASIEAARAGEHGRGFSVVADEVRNLAKRTQDSIVQIEALIKKLQSGTTGVVSAINQGNGQANETAQHVQEAVHALEQIIYAVATIHEMNTQIAKAADEQSDVVDKVNQNIANIRDISESIVTESNNSTGIGEKLTQLSDELQKLMSQFKV